MFKWWLWIRFIIAFTNILLFFYFKNKYYWFPKIIGKPSLPDPIITVLVFGDSESFKVASIPLSFKIFDVNELFNILLALALPSASILNFSASCLAFSNLNTYSKASCSWVNFLSIAALISNWWPQPRFHSSYYQ